MNILFLIGSDLYSYNFANELCAKFAPHDFKASFLVFKNEDIFNPDKLQPEIKDLIYYERTLFSEVVLPFLKNHHNQGNYCGLDALSQKYAINYDFCHNIKNQQALAFILEQAKKWNIDITISLRCAIKLDKKLIDYFTHSNENYLWNIHPGLLPQYRGIMPVFGAMMNKEVQFGFTLHRVAEQLDNGSIIDRAYKDIDYSKSMLQNTMDLVGSGVDLIIKNLQKLSKNEKLPHLLQDESQKGFYSFPTTDELVLFQAKGLSMYTKEEIIKTMQNQYLKGNEKDILNPFL